MDYNYSPSRRELMMKLAAAASAVPFLGLAACGGGAAGAGRTAVVIGAGIAGLSAAYELQKAGFKVTIMEKWDFVGGRMREAQVGPLKIAPHALGVHQNNREMFALAEEVGIKDELAGHEITDGGEIDNGIGVYETGLRFSVDEVAKIPGISAETKAKLPLLQPDLDDLKANVDFCLATSAASRDTETITGYYERLLGKPAAKEVLDYWVTPVLAAWGWLPEETSIMSILPWFAQGTPGTYRPKGGIGVLTRKLGELMPVSTNTSVRYITSPDANGRHTVHYISPTNERLSVTPDVVVCATEGKFIPELVQELDADQKLFFNSIDFTKALSATFILSADGPPIEAVGGSYTPSHPDPIKRRISGWGVGPGRGERPPTASVGMARQETPAWQASNKSQPDYCLPFLKKMLPTFDESRVVDIVTRGCDDLIYTPQGHWKKAAAVLKTQESKKRGLYFAGEFLAGGHTGAACASGRTVARSIIKHFS